MPHYIFLTIYYDNHDKKNHNVQYFLFINLDKKIFATSNKKVRKKDVFCNRVYRKVSVSQQMIAFLYVMIPKLIFFHLI